MDVTEELHNPTDNISSAMSTLELGIFTTAAHLEEKKGPKASLQLLIIEVAQSWFGFVFKRLKIFL